MRILLRRAWGVTINIGDIVSWLLQTATAAGAAVVAFLVLLPSKYGERYLGFRFDQKLALLKDQQNQEIEKLKEQLNHLSDRGKRSNEMEFSAIKSIWEAFVEAYLSTATCAFASVEFPDFLRMSEEEKEAVISGSNLLDEEKDRMRKAKDPNREYVAILNWQQIARAGREQQELRLLIRKQRIFMPKQLSDQFMDAVTKLTSVYVHRKMSFQHKGTIDPFGGPVQEFILSHETMFDQLCAAANERLFRYEKNDLPIKKFEVVKNG
ncbi:MAG TPA: hypothetical protein VE999_19480 [Gemmataceae bacterium]|nr:hypothetical protein [Gemmataceae bacterium]